MMRDAAIDQMARLEDTHWWFVGKRMPRPLNALMIGVYRLEAALARHLRLPLGVSLLCLARPCAVPSA